MFDRFPTELAVKVLDNAVDAFLESDRGTLASLSRTSSAIYEIIAPVLYYTLVVTDTRAVTIRRLLQDPVSSRRVGQHVRHLVTEYECVCGDPPEFQPCLYTILHDLKAVSGYKQHLTSLFTNHPALAQSVETVDIWSRYGLPEEMPAALKRFSVPLSGSHVIHTAMVECATEFPSATGLAFDLVWVDPWQHYPERVPDVTQAVVEAVAECLQTRDDLRVALRFGGIIMRHVDADRLVHELGKACPPERVAVWWDPRIVRSDEDLVGWFVKDAYARRSIWTEAKVLAEYK